MVRKKTGRGVVNLGSSTFLGSALLEQQGFQFAHGDQHATADFHASEDALLQPFCNGPIGHPNHARGLLDPHANSILILGFIWHVLIFLYLLDA